MSLLFEELDDCPTPVGALSLRRRRELRLGGDVFAMATGGTGFDPQAPGRQVDAVLVDIDHAPDHLLDDRSTSFYRAEGLAAVARYLKPGGVFGLWSNEREDRHFTDRLGAVFAAAWAEPVTFDNPLTGAPFTRTVYLARKADA